MGKGGSTQQSVVQTDIPEYAKPYYLDIMDRATAASKDDYVPYESERLAGVNRDIRASRGMIRDIAARGMPATDLALQGTKGLADTAFNLGQQDPYQFSAASFTEQSADPYAGFRQTDVTGYGDFEAAKFKDLSKLFREGDTSRFGGFRAGRADPYAGFSQYGGFEAGRATQGRLSDAGTATAADLESYMDPYSELVTEQLTKKLRKEAGKSAAERGARAASAGAFGGSRQAVMEGIAEDELLDRIASVEAEQSSKAFQDARAAFEADRTARMNVEQARLAERARAQGINIEEAARVQQAESAEAGRFQEAEAAELARTQGINIEEARRVQQDRAAEFARAQGLSLEEAGRVQAAVAQEKPVFRAQMLLSLLVYRSHKLKNLRACRAFLLRRLLAFRHLRPKSLLVCRVLASMRLLVFKPQMPQSGRAFKPLRLQKIWRKGSFNLVPLDLLLNS